MNKNNSKSIYVTLISILLLAGLWATGCGKGWKMDYDDPTAQFHSKDLAEKGKEFVGKKITVKGIVTKVDAGDAETAWVYLDEGIRCNFGEFTRMANSLQIGQTAYVDGFLKDCEKGNILLDPALSRDPSAPFDPVE